ncbi:UNVERIFIED_CONTAM: hypothetical protein PYX00_011486 [Menopon gallinae]|uniref:Disease resistance R13L4/SHOC-2-like LRR domain-containing protein n=1 Tax=Menopon gallinae TaxID=328185 RepID=A0AAW2H7S5_9NEOP
MVKNKNEKQPHPMLVRKMTWIAMVQWIHEVASASLTYRDRGHEEVPWEVFDDTDLQRLDLFNNRLTTLPKEIGSLSQLQELWLKNNRLTTLPKEIESLSQLQKLDLSGNQLTALPKEIGSLSQLQELYLYGNEHTTLPREIGSLPRVQKLYLYNNQLTELPKEIGRLSNLQELYLSNNRLTTLPREIGRLSNLQKLYLYGNQLAKLPREIGSLSRLKELDIGNNRLAKLPREIGWLSQLQELYLYNNKLTALSKEIGRLSNLQKLYLYGNQLTKLPWKIGSLSNLQKLDIAPSMISLIVNGYVKQDGSITMLLFAFRLAYVLVASALLYKRKLRYHLYTGIALFIIAYSPLELLYYLVILCANFSVMFCIANYRLKTATLFVVNFAVIVVGSRCGRSLGVDVGSISSISSEVMFLVPKMYFVCNKQRSLSLSSVSYIFFVPSLAMGPAVPFSELGKRIRRRPETAVLMALQCAAFGLAFAYGHNLVRNDILYRHGDVSVIRRVANLYLYTLHYRTKYYFIWSFSSLCFYACGLSVSNIMFFKVELASSLEEVATYWNYWISRFLKKSIFIPLRKYSRTGAVLVTSIASALWHGGRACDFLFIVSYNLSVLILKQNSMLMKRYLNRYVYVVLVTLQTAFFVSYIPVPFYFNSVERGICVWWNIYFAGHIALLLSLVLHLTLFIHKCCTSVFYETS